MPQENVQAFKRALEGRETGWAAALLGSVPAWASDGRGPDRPARASPSRTSVSS